MLSQNHSQNIQNHFYSLFQNQKIMKKFHFFTLILCLSFFTSCQVLRDLANDQLKPDVVQPDVNVACVAASASTYNESYGIIKEKSFPDDRMVSAKRETTRLKCMTSEQIRKITKLFGFPDDRMTFAKYAYPHCSNPDSYYSTMKSLFDFPDDKMELEELTR